MLARYPLTKFQRIQYMLKLHQSDGQLSSRDFKQQHRNELAVLLEDTQKLSGARRSVNDL